MARKSHKMESEKSGVMIYFKPMRETAHDLDDARLAKLFRAILDFADPESPVSGTDPDFEDETLNYLWKFIREDAIRDDKRYSGVRVGRKYGAYCKAMKHNNLVPLTREFWEMAGCPTFTQTVANPDLMDVSKIAALANSAYAKNATQTPAHAECAMQTPAHAECAMQILPYSSSSTNINSFSFSNAESTTVSVSDAERWSAPALEDVASDDMPNDIDNHDMPDRDAYASDDEWIEAIKNQCEESAKDLPPILRTSSWTTQEAFRKWICYWESTNGRPMPEISRNSLAERFRYYSELYSPPEVLDLIDAAIDSVYKSIPWDRLERNVRRN